MKRIYSLIIFLVLLFAIASQARAQADFSAEYFNNMTLSGAPVLTRTETEINHNWGEGSPDPLVTINQFSARWTGTYQFEEGNYLFTTTTDDGVRLMIDDQTIIDQWRDQGPTAKQATIALAAGSHTIKLEYYENSGGATAVLKWEKIPAGGDPGLRIMPVGDSITDGFDVPGGYRVELKNLVSDTDFVGSQQSGPSQLTDHDHEGHGGWRIHDFQAHLLSWLQAYNPEMVLLLIGANDINSDTDVSGAPQRLSNLIDIINQTVPNADVLVASLTPISNNGNQAKVDTYNQAIPGIVSQKRVQGKKVHYVDMHNALTNADLSDGLHPNSAGYTKMAQKWASAISTVRSGSTPVIPPVVPVDPEPLGEGIFTAYYYNNPTLSGEPVLTRNESAINYEWGTASPHSSILADNFSAKWTAYQTFERGVYEFTVTGDDGVKLEILGNPIIDKWKDQGPTTYTALYAMDGNYDIVFKYYEKTGGATAKLSWKKVAEYALPDPDAPPPDQIPLDNGFRVEYFNNITLSGSYTMSGPEQQINHDWASGPPSMGMNPDYFSARWEGDFTFVPGTYRFTARADDGVRLVVDGQTIINQWKDQGPTAYTVEVQLSGVKRVTLEYYEKTGGAVAQLNWVALQTQISDPEITPDPVTVAPGEFMAEYFNNTTLSGTPVLTRSESSINNNWFLGSPHPTVSSDNFSARWTKKQHFDAGTYKFTVRADDGVRLKVDGQTRIDKWVDQGPTTYSVELTLTAGEHTIIIEYYEKGGGAVAEYSYSTVTNTQPVPIAPNGDFEVLYFNNVGLTGTAVHSAQAPQIDFNWLLGSPHSSVNSDNFSLRAVKTAVYTQGTYRFKVTADDGVRLKINGQTIIDKWIDQAPTTYTQDVILPAGAHTILIEYYEKGWGATLKLEEFKL